MSELFERVAVLETRVTDQEKAMEDRKYTENSIFSLLQESAEINRQNAQQLGQLLALSHSPTTCPIKPEVEDLKSRNFKLKGGMAVVQFLLGGLALKAVEWLTQAAHFGGIKP